MRIFRSPGEPSVLLDSRAGLVTINESIHRFLASNETTLDLEAEVTGDPSPHLEFVPGLRLHKTEGPILLRNDADGWLHLEGSVSNLAIYASHFLFQEEFGHHHPELVSKAGYLDPDTLSLIIEADSEWDNLPIA